MLKPSCFNTRGLLHAQALLLPPQLVGWTIAARDVAEAPAPPLAQ